jgi:hypothetical protein
MMYLKAGRRPKKAMNVSSETAMVKMAMLRPSDIAKGRRSSFHY